MNTRVIVLACFIFVAIVGGMFGYTYLAKQSVINDAANVETPMTDDSNNNAPYGIKIIEGKHFFIDGVHTIAGEIMMPTPCDLLTYSAIVAESFPEQIVFQFDVVNNSDNCAAVVTPQRFVVSATGSAAANLSATIKGVPVELNLIEASSNETPEAFELYRKG